MNRETKFRAWDTIEKKMIPDFTNFAGWKAIAQMENAWADKRYIKLQFTEFSDKNGKEIYEGDILKFDDYESESVDVGIGVDIKVAEIETYNWAPVVYRNGCFGLDINGSELYENRFIDFNELIKSWNENFFKESIVIANIWDNPDFVHEVKR